MRSSSAEAKYLYTHCPELARAVSVDYLRPHQFAVSSISSLFSLTRPRPRLPVRSLLTTALGMVMKGIIWRTKIDIYSDLKA